MSEMADAIRELAQEKGITEEAVKQIVERTIKAAYKKNFGSDENCIVQFSDDLSDVKVFSRKTIVDVAYSELKEIELEDALKYSDECEIGDQIDILVDPKKDFERRAVSVGKQKSRENFNESTKENLYNEFKSKLGETIIGYCQRENKGNIYVDLGKVEGVLPVKFQSPREVFEKNDRIKALVVDIKRTSSGIQLVLSRSDAKFIESILSVEVPEIAENVISIKKIVREAGYRTKIAVSTNDANIDPVGACVGPKGGRITKVIQELEGEKIDILPYSDDPRVLIKNALLPAEVLKVYILDEDKKEALAVVNEENFSIAIGKQGQNVRLANKLCDWNIDVKTEDQVAEMDLSELDTRRAAEELFSNTAETEEYEEITTIGQLPGVDQNVVEILKQAGLDDIVAFIEACEDGSINEVEGLSQEEIDTISSIISENVEFEEEEESSEVESEEDTQAEETEEDDDEEYLCPECGTKITLDMTKCPNCGTEFEFE